MMTKDTSIRIETERLILRNWQPSDTDPMVKQNADPHVMRYYPRPYQRDETISAIAKYRDIIDKKGYGLFAVELKSTQEFIGFIGFSYITFEGDFTPALEIGWRIHSPFWGKGYAPEGAIGALDYLFSNFDVDSVISFTAFQNAPSERVMKKIGMIRTGEFVHPMLSEGHELAPHVLYEIEKDDFLK